jgi:hypothetical protein
LFVALSCVAAACGGGPELDPQGITSGRVAVDTSFWRMSSKGGALERDNLGPWLAGHGRLGHLSPTLLDQLAQPRPREVVDTIELTSATAPAWVLPQQSEISTSAAVLVYGSTPNNNTDRVVIEGSGTGGPGDPLHYIGVVSNMYTGTPTVLKSPSIGGTGINGSALLSSIDGSLVFAVTGAGTVLAVRTSDGGVQWSAVVGSVDWSTPWLDYATNRLFVADLSGNVTCLNGTNGAQIWQTNLGTPLHGSPIVYSSVLWIGGDNGNLYRLNPTTGAQLGSPTNLCYGACTANDQIWSGGFIESVRNRLLLGVNKRLIVIDISSSGCTAASATCSFSAFPIDTTSYASQAGRFQSTPFVSTIGSGSVFVAFDNRLWRINYNDGSVGGAFVLANTGHPTGLLSGSHATSPGYPRSLPFVYNGNVYLGDGGGRMHRFHQNTLAQTADKSFVNPGAVQSGTAPAIDSTALIDVYAGSIYFAVRNPNAPRGAWVRLAQDFTSDDPSPGGPAARLRIDVSATSTQGVPTSVTVTALDASGAVATAYTGTVRFTSSDGAALLPPDYTFTGGDLGVRTFNVTFNTAGAQTVTATDLVTPSINGTGSTTVQGARLIVTPQFTTVNSGQFFHVLVRAVDASGNTLTTYRGTIGFTSSDPRATLPANYTFQAADAGQKLFVNGVRLLTGGSQSITATDTTNPAVTGSATVTVNAPTVASFSVEPQFTSTLAGQYFHVVVRARDGAGQVVPTYTGTIHFATSDPLGLVPANYTFQPADNGVKAFFYGVRLRTGGVQSINVNDTAAPGVVGSANVTVVDPPATTYQLQPQFTTVTVGQYIWIVVTAKDAMNNTVVNYTGTIQFSSSDPLATVPANYTYVLSNNGVKAFFYALRFFTPGIQSVTVTDTANPLITATTNITVN